MPSLHTFHRCLRRILTFSTKMPNSTASMAGALSHQIRPSPHRRKIRRPRLALLGLALPPVLPLCRRRRRKTRKPRLALLALALPPALLLCRHVKYQLASQVRLLKDGLRSLKDGRPLSHS